MESTVLVEQKPLMTTQFYLLQTTILVESTVHTSAKLIEIKFKFLQPKHGPHGTVRQMESNETPHTPWGLRHL